MEELSNCIDFFCSNFFRKAVIEKSKEMGKWNDLSSRLTFSGSGIILPFPENNQCQRKKKEIACQTSPTFYVICFCLFIFDQFSSSLLLVNFCHLISSQKPINIFSFSNEGNSEKHSCR